MRGARRAGRLRGQGLLRARGERPEGVVSVEMALIAPILIVLLFGIVELGLIFRDMMALNQAAREASRTAAIGGSTSEIIARLRGAGGALDPAQLTQTLQFRTFTGGTPNPWVTLGDVSEGGVVRNNAPSGAQVRVLVNYSHRLVTGALFSGLADSPGGNTMRLSASLVMRRE